MVKPNRRRIAVVPTEASTVTVAPPVVQRLVARRGLRRTVVAGPPKTVQGTRP